MVYSIKPHLRRKILFHKINFIFTVHYLNIYKSSKLVSYIWIIIDYTYVTLFEDALTEIIRHCKFQQVEKDEIIIKQGERGDRYDIRCVMCFIVTNGNVSSYDY